MEFIILTDSAGVKLDCYGPLANMKFRSQKLEEARRRRLYILRSIGSIIAWACLAFILWWVIEQPAEAAHEVHVFFASM